MDDKPIRPGTILITVSNKQWQEVHQHIQYYRNHNQQLKERIATLQARKAACMPNDSPENPDNSDQKVLHGNYSNGGFLQAQKKQRKTAPYNQIGFSNTPVTCSMLIKSNDYEAEQRERAKPNICNMCIAKKQRQNSKQPSLALKDMKQQWNLWSMKIEQTLKNKSKLNDPPDQTINGLQPIQAERRSSNLVRSDESQTRHLEVLKSEMIIPNSPDLFLLENICIFGPNEKYISSCGERKFACKQQLFFPSKQECKAYGNYLYPQDVAVRRVKGQNRCGQVANRIIFRKNSKKSDCNVFIFQPQEGHALEKGQIKEKVVGLIKQCNPSKWLYGINLQFCDFICFDEVKQEPENSQNIKIQVNQCEKKSINSFQTQKNPLASKTQEVLFTANFCLCVLTYFPFINFFSDMLINIIDVIKIRRIQKYNQNVNAKHSKIDINFFIQQFKDINAQIMHTIISSPLSELLLTGGFLHMPIGKDKSIFLPSLTQPSNLQSLLYADWTQNVLKLFDKETLYDLYCNIMMEKSIYFVSANKYILTYTMLLFLSALTKPFIYPHPCVSIVFDEELLQTPFTAILGINKESQWVNSKIGPLSKRKPKVIICDLNGSQAKIVTSSKSKHYKSEELKRVFSHFYRCLENSKKRPLASQGNEEECCPHFCFLRGIRKYLEEQILSNLPNQAIITTIIEQLEQSQGKKYAHVKAMQEIKKFLKQLRSNREKDFFASALIQQQIFLIYLSDRYGIN